MLLSELSWIIYNVGRLTYCFRQVVTVGWANGSIVNPTLMPSSLGCEKHVTQATTVHS